MALGLEKKTMQQFRTIVRKQDIFSTVIQFLMEGGVFKIGDRFFAFSHDMLLCELVNAVEIEEGGVEANEIKPSNLTFNEFIHGCMNASRESIEQIDFVFCKPETEC
jgi:hypothetical protein